VGITLAVLVLLILILMVFKPTLWSQGQAGARL